ncbi:TPA: hypothetical protein OKD94_004143 [Escherichia coli]|nr:hypothetical protein [Escherichia coli]HCQ3786629.1 hypothetical protein [Escherichia coli]
MITSFKRYLVSAALIFITASTPIAYANSSDSTLKTQGETATPRTTEYSWMSVKQWNELFDASKKIAESGKEIDVLFFGDSITAGWPSDILSSNLPGYNLENFSIGGDHTGNMLWRIEHIDTRKIHPKLVVLLAGVNNFGHLNETPEQVALGVNSLIEKIREKLPKSKILLLGVFPNQQSADSPEREKVKELNNLLSHNADNKKIYYADFGNVFLEPDGSIDSKIMSDYLHPTRIGYEKLITLLAPKIKSLTN